MKKKLLSTLLTLALLLPCGNAPAAEHVHQLLINPTCIPYNLESVHTKESKIMANRIKPAKTISSLS